jgi:hypothetical protein
MTNQSQPSKTEAVPVSRPLFPAILESVAYHEAGHAVAFLALGLHIEYVALLTSRGDIGDGTEVAGECSGAATPEWFKVGGAITPEAIDLAERLIVTNLAGVAAQNRYLAARGRRENRCAGQDLAAVTLLAGWVFADPVEKRSALARLEARTVELVSRPGHWLAIEKIAQSLLVRTRLTGEEVRREFDACA